MERRNSPGNVRFSGARGKRYGIWDLRRMRWRPGIGEDSPMLAEARFAYLEGSMPDAARYAVRELPPGAENDAKPDLAAELARKDAEIRSLKRVIRNLKARLGESPAGDQQAEIEFTRD